MSIDGRRGSTVFISASAAFTAFRTFFSPVTAFARRGDVDCWTIGIFGEFVEIHG